MLTKRSGVTPGPEPKSGRLGRVTAIQKSLRRLGIFSLVCAWLLAAVFVSAPLTLSVSSGGSAAGKPQTAAAKTSAPRPDLPHISLAKLPMRFERNDGQTDARVKFLSRGEGYTLFITPTEAVLTLRQPSKEPSLLSSFRRADKIKRNDKLKGTMPVKAESEVIRVKLAGVNPNAQIEGVDRLRGKSNYFIGSDPKKWHTDVPNYSKVGLKSVYPGIDLIYHGSEQGHLEYDFRLAPGADPDAIRLGFKGPDKLVLDEQGALIVSVGEDNIVEHAPEIYQEIDGKRVAVAGGWKLYGAHEAGFDVARYDRSKPIVIDPLLLLYSTYLGGGDNDVGFGIAVDSSGNAYITGVTYSSNFPTLNAYESKLAGSYNAFVAKLDPSPSGPDSLLYSTYLGGNGGDGGDLGVNGDSGQAIAVDSSGIAYVTGGTASITNASCTASGVPETCCTGAGTGTCIGFPITAGAYQSTNNGAANGAANVFVTKL